jgi:hypothetical protein
MTEREIDERRNWKAQVFPYDYFTVEPGRECQYCLTDKQAELLLGLIEPLSWKTRWWTEGEDEIDRDVIDQFRNDLARRLMMGCCGDETPTQYRWTEDGELERSDDGGETWEADPENDPRNNSTRYPPIEGEDGADKKCAAATGMAMLIEEQIGENLTDEMTRYTLQQLISDWVNVFIQTSNIFTALITIATNQIFALSIAIIRPALTEEVYDQLKCIFYCHMSDDASFDNAQWAAVRAQILSDITGVAGLFLEHLVYLLGSVGLTNLARSSGATEGDCSECDCFDACADNWEIRGDLVDYCEILERGEDFVTCRAHTPLSNGVYYVDIRSPSLADCCYFDHYDILAGTVSGIAGTDCGQDLAPVGGLWTGHCVWILQPQSSTSFTIKLFLTPCP